MGSINARLDKITLRLFMPKNCEAPLKFELLVEKFVSFK